MYKHRFLIIKHRFFTNLDPTVVAAFCVITGASSLDSSSLPDEGAVKNLDIAKRLNQTIFFRQFINFFD
jgi:hypothetical protein